MQLLSSLYFMLDYRHESLMKLNLCSASQPQAPRNMISNYIYKYLGHIARLYSDWIITKDKPCIVTYILPYGWVTCAQGSCGCLLTSFQAPLPEFFPLPDGPPLFPA